MSDNLRDRIADVLADEFKRQGYACEWAVLADAVIEALDLRQEHRELMDGMCGQSINYLTGQVTNHYRAATRQHRYVTEWTTDD